MGGNREVARVPEIPGPSPAVQNCAMRECRGMRGIVACHGRGPADLPANADEGHPRERSQLTELACRRVEVPGNHVDRPGDRAKSVTVE